MSGALGFILNAAGLIAPLALQAKYATQAVQEATSVQIIAGSGANDLGGDVPHVALWDDDGNRIGQWHPGKKDKIRQGDVKTIMVPHKQNHNKQADPYYVMLSNLKNDAICIAAVTVANQKVSATFFGDTGYMCGQSWFLSDNKIGSNYQKPKCVWLDADHTNKINARALSFHVNDMAPSADKISQYQKRPETLCQSTPRFSFWGNLEPNGIVPFFKPKLRYKDDSTNQGEGADEKPDRVVDKKNQYDKSVYMYQGEKSKRAKDGSRRGGKPKNTPRGSNHNPEHLIITDHVEDDVRHVCEHPNSYGWDIVSTVQKLYCDMEHKQLYPVCDGKQYKDNCFDMNGKSIIPKEGIASRDELAILVPRKNYTSEAHWES
ncbi:hypothetical protein E4U31_005838 [Claviceps sp. LM219 group G6]|nr:hypothetical protein E4U15_000918 [Claviceps sp. LM218 group G6]KAG6114266.1 hypothetical protein E4U31_005838 [Claviceps sp. LM219 group G6]KAG6118944.1 hypothetical protein E4U14_006065 [Claviceps sp. LM454 group G7]